MSCIKIQTSNNLRGYSIGYFIVIAIAFSIFITIIMPDGTSAAPVVGFKPGNIMEDSVFTNSNSMTTEQIQVFLASKVPSCDSSGQQISEYGGPDLNADGKVQRWEWGQANYGQSKFVCIKDYTENGLSAAQIISDASRKYSINPQVLIVLLQKEQGLITDTWPLNVQYRSATGYGCPDTAPCDTQYYGLTNQVNWSATMFRAILNNSPTWYTPYVLGANFIQWSPNSACGGTVVNIENRATQALYNYTPYQPNQAALNAGYGMGDSCSAYGNRNFYLYFSDWFGYNSGPVAFKSESSSTIYLAIEGYKLVVPHGAIMQDYGISYEAVETVSDAYVSSVPNPPAESGISSGISHVVKSPRDDDEDGGSIYLISRGIRYQIQSMEQFFSLGFTEPEISHLPLSYIYGKKNGQLLPGFFTSPNGAVFKHAGATKRLYFEYDTYINDNPSDRVALFSYYLVDKIPSASPVTTRPVLIKYRQGEAVLLYTNNNYYEIPDFDTFSCWGLEGVARTPVYRLAQDNYIGTVSYSGALDCTVGSSGSVYHLEKTKRYLVPPELNVTPSLQADSNLEKMVAKIPLRNEQLSRYIKSHGDAAVWQVGADGRKLIPTYRTFLLLGLSEVNVDTVYPSLINSIPMSGIKLANGQLVKTKSSDSVYAIFENNRFAYHSSDTFISYDNNWEDIETLDQSLLDSNYPYGGQGISSYFVDKALNKAYLMALNNCFELGISHLAGFGTSLDALKIEQVYDASTFRNLDKDCANASNFIKLENQSLVYWVSDGKKHALETYSAMISLNGGTNPVVMVVGRDFIESIPTGQSLR